MDVATLSTGTSAGTTARRVGLIINPRSHANKAGQTGLDHLPPRHPPPHVATPDGPAALAAALRHFAAASVNLLVVSGGDGTLRDVLSALPLAYHDGLPEIAILAAGNTNLAARVLGSPGRGAAGLIRLLDALAAGTARRITARLLQVSWVNSARPPVSGFLFGAAGFTTAKRLADTKIHRRGVHRGLAVGAAIAASLLRVLAGGGALRAGTAMRVGVDAGAAHDGPRLLLLATTLNRLMLGLWPFWGTGAGAINWLDIDAPPARLPTALWAMLAGRRGAWLAAHGYRAGRAETLHIELDQPFMLDGEAFETGPAGIILSATRHVTVVSA